jgi:uncharacterized membrane protein
MSEKVKRRKLRRATGRRAQAGPARLGIWGRIRNYFLTGVLVTAPTLITLYIAFLILDLVDSWVTPFIPHRFNPATYLPFRIPGLGLLLMLVALTLIGAVAASLIGRYFVRLGERLVARMPVIRKIYGAVKQLVEAVFSNNASAFRQVVLIEWPRKGVWTLGFVANVTAGEVEAKLGRQVRTVMVPTTPNPTSGYLVFVPAEAVIELDISVENAMKLVLSSGIVLPPDVTVLGGPLLDLEEKPVKATTS